MSTLSKANINPVQSIKSLVQGAFVEWAINEGDMDWTHFITSHADDLRQPLRLALGHMKMASPDYMAMTTHTAGLMQLCITFDIISGYEKAMRDRLQLLEKSREHEQALAQENQKITGSLLDKQTRYRLAGNIDRSVTLLTLELDQLQDQLASDIDACTRLNKRVIELETEADTRDVDVYSDTVDEEDEQGMALVASYKGANRRIDTLMRRRAAAITRTMELTTQLQSSIAAFDLLNASVVGMVDATYNYANPEQPDELSQTSAQPYLEADVSDSRNALQAHSE